MDDTLRDVQARCAALPSTAGQGVFEALELKTDSFGRRRRGQLPSQVRARRAIRRTESVRSSQLAVGSKRKCPIPDFRVRWSAPGPRATDRPGPHGRCPVPTAAILTSGRREGVLGGARIRDRRSSPNWQGPLRWHLGSCSREPRRFVPNPVVVRQPTCPTATQRVLKYGGGHVIWQSRRSSSDLSDHAVAS